MGRDKALSGVAMALEPEEQQHLTAAQRYVVIGSAMGALLLGFFIGRTTATTVPHSRNSAPAASPESAVAFTSRASDTGAATTARSTSERSEGARAVTLDHLGDPVAQLQAENRTGSEIGRVVRMIGILSQLSKDDIPNVLAYAVGLRSAQRQEREILFFGALTRWAQFDPTAAAEWTRSNASSSLKGKDDDLLEMALSEWTVRDAATARAWIDQLTEPGQKAGAFRGYLAALSLQDPVAALQEMERMPEDVRDQRAYAAIFRSWSSKDPRAAAQAAANLSLPDANARRQAMGIVAEVWGQQAPREAVAWALGLSKSEEQSQIVRDVLREWVQREPQAAVSQLLSLPPSVRDEAACDVVETVAQKDSEGARRIAEELPPGPGRDQALGIVAVTWASRDPSAAADFARNLSEEAAADAWPKIARSWVQRGEPSAPAEWVAQLPEGPARSGAARNVIDRWAKIEPAAAAQWVERLPGGPTRDASAATFAMGVREADPATAMEWAAMVSNLNQRESTVRQVLDTWRKKDPAAAKAWLENTNAIGADLRSVLLRAP
jgi:hypothetical protein